jgi:mannosyltransferase OCH1-like enzyme
MIKTIKLIGLFTCVSIYAYILYTHAKIKTSKKWARFDYKNKKYCNMQGCIDNYIDFEGFDNQNPNQTKRIVPNIIHLVYINKTEMKFPEMIATLSMYVNHKPDWIYIHCNNCSFGGKYWNKIQKIEGLRRIIVLKNVKNLNKNIFGNEFSWIQHRADTFRLNIMMNYGGIYMDAGNN